MTRLALVFAALLCAGTPAAMAQGTVLYGDPCGSNWCEPSPYILPPLHGDGTPALADEPAIPLVTVPDIVRPTCSLKNFLRICGIASKDQPTIPIVKPGDICQLIDGTIRCGMEVKCRAYVGPNLIDAREEIWAPRQEGDSIVCDETDRPSVKARVQQ